MLHKIKYLTSVAAVVALTAAPAFAQTEKSMHAMVHAGELEFADIQPEGFDPGVKLATVHGDPSVADQPYVIRLSFPDGYRFPAHYHPKDEHLTVLSGSFQLAMGSEVDDSKLKTFSPGDYLYMPAEKAHFGGVKGKTVIQLHGVGPFEVLLAEAPAGSN